MEKGWLKEREGPLSCAAGTVGARPWALGGRGGGTDQRPRPRADRRSSRGGWSLQLRGAPCSPRLAVVQSLGLAAGLGPARPLAGRPSRAHGDEGESARGLAALEGLLRLSDFTLGAAAGRLAPGPGRFRT